MANSDQPRGFRIKGNCLRVSPYVAGGTIYPGDAVHQENDGKVDAAAASEALCGVAASYATDGQTVLVYDHPDQKFVVQAAGASVSAQTDINLNYPITATAGSSTYKQSRQELDDSAGATTATLPLKLLAIDSREDNAFGANVDCVVIIANHQLSNAGLGNTGI